MKNFKIGDRVKIIKEVRNGNTQYKGLVGTITNFVIDAHYPYSITFKGVDYYLFKEDELENFWVKPINYIKKHNVVN